ncbi:unnamed protein product [Mytilus coruscus]|uniref:Ig-like domain-containing protein n=1 Tax=Mytilus coruscus TaxID=42192 RepID=A0A6J7ZXM5_MYTCO|nr:unnamed protein product [Mytilus coruscus]
MLYQHSYWAGHTLGCQTDYQKLYIRTIAFEIFINENRSGLLGSNDTSLECSFNKAEGEDVLSLFFLYKNKTSHSYEDIVVFTSSAVPRLTAKGNYLSERIDLPKHTLSSSPAAITFSDLQCQDNARYKCRITYQIRRTFEKYTVESYATQINVQADKLTTPSICTGSCPGSNENAENSNINKVDLIVTGMMIAIGLIGIIVSVVITSSGLLNQSSYTSDYLISDSFNQSSYTTDYLRSPKLNATKQIT